MNNEWRSRSTTDTAKNARGSHWRIYYCNVVSFVSSVWTPSLFLSLFLTPIPFSSTTERAYTKMRSLLARRHTSWLLIHVAADYFPASLWHQIPYSGQNGESASPLPTRRARWSTQASDSHRILYTQIVSPHCCLEIFRFSIAQNFTINLNFCDMLSPKREVPSSISSGAGHFTEIERTRSHKSTRSLSIRSDFLSDYLFVTCGNKLRV